MSVTSSKRRSLEKEANDSKTEQNITDQYIITVSSTSDDQVTILASNHADIPQIGDPHPNPASTATVKSRAVTATGNRLTWLLDVTYSDATSTADQPGQGSQTEVLSVSIGKWDETFILEMDYTPKKPIPVQNTAGDKLKLEAIRPQFMMTISSITQDPTLKGYFDIQGHVNSDEVTWLGFHFKKGQLLFDEYKATTMGNNTWREDFIFKGKKVPNYTETGKDPNDRRGGWQPQLLMAGFREINDKGVRVPIRPRATPGAENKETSPVTSPWPLNRGGQALTMEDINDDKASELFVFKEFIAYPSANFDGGAFNFNFDQILTKKEKKQIG